MLDKRVFVEEEKGVEEVIANNLEVVGPMLVRGIEATWRHLDMEG